MSKDSQGLRTGPSHGGIVRRPDICIISEYFLPDINGDVIRLLSAIDALRDEGFKITLLTAVPHFPLGKIPSKYRRMRIFREHWNGVNIIRVPMIPMPHTGFLNRLLLYSSFSLFSIFSIPLLKKVDIVWAFSQRIFSSIPGALIKLFKKAILVTDMTDVWPHALVNTGYLKTGSRGFSLINTLAFLALRVSDYVTTLTSAMSSLISNHWRTPEGKLHILRNSIDTNTFVPMKAKRSKELQGRFVVMYSGNLGANYDFNAVLRCASELRCRDDILFIIRGHGEMSKPIQNWIRKNTLNNVILDNRILGRDELVKYLNMADAYILPMKKCKYPDASFPMKLLDYMACGKPVLCCSEGYLSEFISKYKVGIATGFNDYQGAVKAVLFLKENVASRRQMGENARRLALHFFSYETFREKVTRFFTQIRLNSSRVTHSPRT